jgi:predicted permease
VRNVLRRIVLLFSRRRFDDEMNDELTFHQAMKQQALEGDGLTPAEAGIAARRAVGGGALRFRERARDVWVAPAIDAFAQDVRHAIRLLRRNPGFAITALCTLALGIGLNTAIFSIVYGVLVKPLNYRDPSRLVAVLSGEVMETGRRSFVTWTPPDYHELAASNQTLDGLAAYTGLNKHLTGQGEPQQLWGIEVTPNFFDVLGVPPAIGRGFVQGPLTQPAIDANSVIISDRLWRRVFNADPSVLGRAIALDGEPKTIVGVLRADFVFRLSTFNLPEGLDLICPNDWRDVGRNNAFLALIGRLRSGITREQAESDVTGIKHRIEEQLPRSGRPSGPSVARVVDLHAQVVSRTARQLVTVLAGAVLLVLLIVCVNIANLQLARWSSRRTELSLRMALGAGRRRIVHQLLSESLVLALAGGALGAALAYAAVPALLAQLPIDQLPRIEEIRVNTPVLIFSLLLAMATGVLFGLLPALRHSTLSGADDLRGSSGAGRTATSGRQTERLRSALVIGQVALTLVLLVSAGLLMHSFLRLLSVQPGFTSDDVVTMSVVLPDRVYTTPAQSKAFTGAVLDRLRDMPGAGGASTSSSSASAVTMVPFGIFGIHGDFEVEGQPKPKFNIGKPKIGPDYFKTLGIPLLSGRDFQRVDTAEAPKVAIVSDSVARRLWPGARALALGKRLRLDDKDWLTVVGVVGDVRQSSLQEPLETTIYVPYQQENRGFFLQTVTFVARTTTPQATADFMRQSIRQAAPDVPVADVKTMQALVSESMAQPRIRTLLIGSFALCALLIATLGIYGVMTYAVTQRRREIGIRMAIGAEWTDVVWLVLRRALLIVAAGAILGIAASFAVTKTLTSFLFEVTPTDPLAIAGVTILLVLVALTAAWLPARRAAQTDPVEALRVE